MKMIWFFSFTFGFWGCATLNDRPLELAGGSIPIYPKELKNSGIEGHVLLKYDVSREGKVMNIKIIGSEPPFVFDSAAVETLMSWRFRARVVSGVPQFSRGVVSRISFRVTEQSSDL